ncbi:MAG: lysine N(6)-hydroxylase/L-ornithine N(5)-oxygenase family protein [Chloroflexi bacterium]|nr:lysine N(6)-hydroxylase/L-ornithine N(5)-oxygenase family protein [Chloroflexota bacterium]
MTATNVPTLAVLGAGPKGIAIAAKARVLRELGLADVRVIVIEATDIAADWQGCSGWTDGAVRLGTSPEKDVGFPYRSDYGKAVDAAMTRFSWQSHLVAVDLFDDWIDRGRPQPLHRDWARYLRWAFSACAPELLRGRLTAATPHADGFALTVATDAGDQIVHADGLVLTGPGDPITLDAIQTGPSAAILDGRNFWQQRESFADMFHGRIAVVGGGETAASVATSLLDRPGITVDIISRRGIIYTRGESYLENRYYSLPIHWQELDEDERVEFINRTDRGVFSVAAKQRLDQAAHIRMVTGSVQQIRPVAAAEHGHDGVDLEIAWNGATQAIHYDKVVVAIGFDPLTTLRVLPADLRAKGAVDAAIHRVDQHLRLPLTPDLNLHTPMLAGLAQGPGFPNLSSLGTVADRILSHYAPIPS